MENKLISDMMMIIIIVIVVILILIIKNIDNIILILIIVIVINIIIIIYPDQYPGPAGRRGRADARVPEGASVCGWQRLHAR